MFDGLVFRLRKPWGLWGCSQLQSDLQHFLQTFENPCPVPFLIQVFPPAQFLQRSQLAILNKPDIFMGIYAGKIRRKMIFEIREKDAVYKEN
jgi:hypothetical protein